VAERLGDADLWRSVERTLHEVLLPAIPEEQEWARTTAVQLIGLARYAAARPPDATAERVAELRAALAALAGNPLVEGLGDDADAGAVFEAAGRALAAAVGRHDAGADQVRRAVRPVVVRHLDDELAVTAPLVAAFRGRLDE
jgi:hypothetical protein